MLLAVIPLSAQPAPVDEDNTPLYSSGDTAGVPGTEGTDGNTVQSPKLNIPVWDYIKMILVLAGVIGAIYLIFFLLKKGVRKNLPDNGSIKVISTCTLQGNSLLCLVEVGTNIFLVGTGDGKLNLISAITDKESIDTIRLAAAEGGTAKKQPFSDILLNLFKPGRRQNANLAGNAGEAGTHTEDRLVQENGNSDNPIDFIKRQRDRLQNMR